MIMINSWNLRCNNDQLSFHLLHDNDHDQFLSISVVIMINHQVLPHRLRHIRSPPSSHEIFYEPTGKEAQPRPIGSVNKICVFTFKILIIMDILTSQLSRKGSDVGLQVMNTVSQCSSIDQSVMSTTSGLRIKTLVGIFYILLKQKLNSFLRSRSLAGGSSSDANNDNGPVRRSSSHFYHCQCHHQKQNNFLIMIITNTMMMKTWANVLRNLDSDCLIFESR